MRVRAYVEDLIRFGQAGHRLYVAVENLDGTNDIMQNPIYVKLPQHSIIQEKDALLDDAVSGHVPVRDFLQAMSDAAWEIGIKPKQLESHTNELKAVRDHVADMRMVVTNQFDILKIAGGMK